MICTYLNCLPDREKNQGTLNLSFPSCNCELGIPMGPCALEFCRIDLCFQPYHDVPRQNSYAKQCRSYFICIPTETIVEIFHSCLPTYPLEYRQPHTTIVAMLLCQVSSLRCRIAMTTPTLWIYLNHVGYVATEDFLAAQILHKAIWPIETAFLKWWMTNLKSSTYSRLFGT